MNMSPVGDCSSGVEALMLVHGEVIVGEEGRSDLPVVAMVNSLEPPRRLSHGDGAAVTAPNYSFF